MDFIGPVPMPTCARKNLVAWERALGCVFHRALSPLEVTRHHT